MVVDFTSEQKEEILKRMTGKSIPYTHYISYDHGRSVKLTITGISRAKCKKESLDLQYDITLDDGTFVSLTADGDEFFDEYIDEIRHTLNEDIFYVCSRDGVYPIMMKYDDLKASGSWLISHDYNGRLIFENYSRAMICWYEKNEGKSWVKQI